MPEYLFHAVTSGIDASGRLPKGPPATSGPIRAETAKVQTPARSAHPPPESFFEMVPLEGRHRIVRRRYTHDGVTNRPQW
ncbi:MAG: hypothetical protein HYZ39_25270 [Mycolicibacterium cosmeticum]|nr:hypothetical protein [Mycolicibacterium cosmeticum]